MLDENLPTYRFRASSDNPLNSLLYFTHNGSEPSADYLIKRPTPSSAPNQYALGLFDIQYANVLYAEVLVKPDWSQPSLSAAEVRANGGHNAAAMPIVPRSFSISLYNPDTSVQVNYKEGSWSKDSWEFDVPERSFRMPSKSQLDQDAPDQRIADLIPKVNLKWKRDGRMNRDMTCYMSGKTVGGKKNKEPDITVALFKASKTEGAVSIYEPNMARVDVEDRKGLEVVLLLSAEVIRELWLSSRQDVFNTAGVAPPAAAQNAKPIGTHPAAGGASAAMAGGAVSGAAMSGAAMSGALHNAPASSSTKPQQANKPASKPAQPDPEEERRRQKRVQREQEEIKRMLEKEEREEQRRKQREREEREKQVDRETQELLKKYGPQPNLPPRPGQQQQQQQRPAQPSGSGGGGSWMSSPFAGSNQAPQQPPRPKSVDPKHATSSGGGNVHFAPPENAQQNGNSGGGSGGGAFKKFGNFLSSTPYNGPGAARVSGFFGGGGEGTNSKTEEEDRKKRQKALRKRSSQF